MEGVREQTSIMNERLGRERGYKEIEKEVQPRAKEMLWNAANKKAVRQL